MKKILGMMLGLGLMAAPSAHALIYVNVLGGANFANPTYSPPTPGATTSAKLGLAYGATAEFVLMPMFSIEAGVLSLTNKTETQILGVSSTSSYKSTEIPVLFRFTALPLIDVGAGPYYAMMPGSSSDYGARLSARAKFPLAPLMSVLIDVNYDYGFKNIGNDIQSAKRRAYGVLGGIAVGF